MLPEHLTGSYARYKADTAVFATWLMKSAQACGYHMPQEFLHSREANDRVKDQPHRYSLPVRELLAQAQVIVSSHFAHSSLPGYVECAAKSAILARTRFARTFQAMKIEDESTSGHLHFISVMTEALETLKSTKSQTKTPPEGPRSEQSPAVLLKALANRSEALELHETPETDEQQPQMHASLSAADNGEVVDVREELQDREVAISEIVRIMCFFDDSEKIRLFLKETWSQYRRGEIVLETAAMTTNAAVLLTNQAHSELCDVLGMEWYNSYALFGQALRCTDSLTLAALASRFERPRAPIDLHTQIVIFFTRLITGMCRDPQTSSPFPVVYSFKLIALIAPQVKKSPRYHRVLREDDMLCQLLMDLYFTTFSGFTSKDCDEITRHLSDFMKLPRVTDCQFPVTLVLACRYLLDIHDVLDDDLRKPWAELKCLAEECTDQHKSCVRFQKSDPTFGWNEKDVPYLDSMLKLAHFVAHEDDGTEIKTAAVKKWQQVQLAQQPGQHLGVQPIPQGLLYIKNNPVLCGTLAMKLRLLMEDIGMRLANHHLSTVNLAYLYSTMAPRGLIAHSWPEMDLFIATQIKALFFGKLPTSPSDVEVRYALRSGYTLKELADNRRERHSRTMVPDVELAPEGVTTSQSRKKPQCLEMTDTSSVWTKYFNEDETKIRCLYQVKKIFDKATKKPPMRATSFHPANMLDTLDFVTGVRDWMHRNTAARNLDYIGLALDSKLVMQLILWAGLDAHAESKGGTPRSIRDYSRWSESVYFCHLTRAVIQMESDVAADTPGARAIPRDRSPLCCVAEHVTAFLEVRRLCRGAAPSSGEACTTTE